MVDMEFEWDEAKAASNLRKHGIDFTEAIEAVLDPHRVEQVDDRFRYDEERLSFLGMSRGRLLLVATTYPDDEHAGSFRRGRRRGMSIGNIIRVRIKPGEPLPKGDTDWARVDAMTEDEIMAAALSDPDAQPLTPEQLARMRRIPNVKAIRERLNMTQEEFAYAYRLSLRTVQGWEGGSARLDATARALLAVIEREPEAARRALA